MPTFYAVLSDPRFTYLAYAIAGYGATGVLNYLFHPRTDAEDAVFRATHPRLAAARSLLKALGLDTPRALDSLKSLVSGYLSAARKATP